MEVQGIRIGRAYFAFQEGMTSSGGRGSREKRGSRRKGKRRRDTLKGERRREDEGRRGQRGRGKCLPSGALSQNTEDIQ